MAKITLNEDQQLYIRSMKKLLRVTAITTSVDEANAYMEKHSGAAVVAEFEPVVLLADKNDNGLSLNALQLAAKLALAEFERISYQIKANPEVIRLIEKAVKQAEAQGIH